LKGCVRKFGLGLARGETSAWSREGPKHT
jgi:hypothetical protein